MTVLLAAANVGGLARGVYEYRPRERVFDLAASGGEVIDALRDAYVRAPAFLLICDSPTAEQPAGSTGQFGRGLLRAGSLGYCAWLAALSAGLCGSVHGRVSYEVAEGLRGLRRPSNNLFALAVGHPA